MAGENSLLTLLLKVEGGTASAAEVELLKGKLESLDTEVNASQSNLQGKFSQNFEHIALRGFLADGMRAIGMSGEMRPVLTVLQMGLMGVAGAVDIWIVGLTAVAGLLYTVYEHSKKHAKGLDEVLQKYKDAVTSIDDYVAAGGKLTDALAKVNAQNKEQEASTLKAITATHQKTLADDQATLATLKRHQTQKMDIDGMQMSVSAMFDYEKEEKKINDAIDRDTTALQSNAKGYANYSKMVEGETEHLKNNTEEKKKAEEATKKLSEANRKASEEQNRLAGVYESAVNSMAEKQKQYTEESKILTDDLYQAELDKITAWADKERSANEAKYSKMLADLKKYTDDSGALSHGPLKDGAAYANELSELKAHESNIAALKQNAITEREALDNLEISKKKVALEKLLGVEHTGWAAIEQTGVTALKGLVDASSQDLAKMLVQHQSFTNATKYLWRDLIQNIIQGLIKQGEQAVVTAAIHALQSKKSVVSAIEANAEMAASSAATSKMIIADNAAIVLSYEGIVIAAKAAKVAMLGI